MLLIEKSRDYKEGYAHVFQGDNIKLIKSLIDDKKLKDAFKLIYIDPPFFSKAKYDAVVKAGEDNFRHRVYEDRWKGGLSSYLKMLTSRLVLMRELLRDDGLIWVHLDWHSVHYVKVIMDEIFGSDNFVNEIIWTYKSGGTNKKSFSKKHDTILVYSKSEKYSFFPLKEKSYNRGYKPYHFKGVPEFQDELGWYTEVNMKDVWSIDMVGRTSAERTGYATQKPQMLIKRILQSCTKEGDLCGDFFSGSGTTAFVAAELKRQFICCDESPLAVEDTIKRLGKSRFGYVFYREKTEKKGKMSCKIKVDKNNVIGNQVEYRICIKKIKESCLNDMVEEKDLELLGDLIKNNSTILLSSWSVDFDFDGICHRPCKTFYRNKSEIEREVSVTISSQQRLSIKVTDIFGNTYFERV